MVKKAFFIFSLSPFKLCHPSLHHQHDFLLAQVVSMTGAEMHLRYNGIGVIHGGDNALRQFFPGRGTSSSQNLGKRAASTG